MRTPQIAFAAGLLALSLTACGSDGPSDQSPPPAPTATANPEDGPPSAAPALEGDASTTARWPDGITARLAKVERVPNSWASSDLPSGSAVFRLTLEAGNEGQGPLPIESGSRQMTMFYGVNRTEAEQNAGSVDLSNPDESKRQELVSEDPTRIAPGSKAVFVESFVVPVGEIGSLTVQVDLPAEEGIRDPYTFTGVERVVKTVK